MAGPATAEVLGDVEVGGDTGSRRNDIGLTAEEQAAFDDMMRETSDDPDLRGGDDGDLGDVDADPPAVIADPVAPVLDKTQTPPADDEDPEVPEPQPDPRTGKTPGRNVSYGKYKRELEKRDTELTETRARMAQQATDFARLDERLTILNQALAAVPAAAPDPAAPPAPKSPWEEETVDPAVDAIAALSQMQRRQEWTQRQGTQQFEATQEVLGEQEMLRTFQGDVARYSGTEEGKNFSSAYQFLKDHRLTELSLAMFSKNPNDPKVQFTREEVNRLVNDFNEEEKSVVGNAIRNRQSPAATVMAFALHRGWQPPAAEAAPPVVPAPPVKTNGAAPPAAAARVPAVAESAVQKIKREADAQAASQSLSDGNGTPPPPVLTPEALMRMSPKEFDRLVDQLEANGDMDRLHALLGKPDDDE